MYLASKVSHLISRNVNELKDFRILKKSIDARKKDQIYYIYTVQFSTKNEKQIVKASAGHRTLKGKVTYLEKKKTYDFKPSGKEVLKHRPVIIGSGPAGLFCAWMLAKEGYRPIVIERGKDVDRRLADVSAFWDGGTLNPQSNVQFGEGGAGTFSDGKLNTAVKDKYGRNQLVLETFVKNGAQKEILYDAKPHIGTDILKNVVKHMREQIQAFGGEFKFEHQMTGLDLEGQELKGIYVSQGETTSRLDCDCLVLAIGHSARDTFEMLYENGLCMEAKSFAVGVRIQHRQDKINEAQYGKKYAKLLPAAPYKLTAKASNGRGVYSFCMCPGGYVVNASSEQNALAINGMSYSDRASGYANSGLIVTVTPEDYPGNTPLSGVAFQRDLEQKAYKEGHGKIPTQLYKDFKEKKSTASLENIFTNTKGATAPGDIRNVLPEAVCTALLEGIEQFGHCINGYNDDKALLMAVESRTSSPVRIIREETSLESNIGGIYPCGEGAGYAGGITSAGIDGIKIYEAIASKYAPFSQI